MLRLAPAAVQVDRKNANTYLRSPQKLDPYARCVTEWLVHWSDKDPTRTFLAERKGEGWRKLSYRETYGAVRRIAQALLEQGLNAERPVAILSDNGIDHALLSLGAMHVGIPVAPISPAYSLMSKDFGKLKHIFELLKPGLVFAADAARFGPALEAVGAKSASVADMLEVNPGSLLTAFQRLERDGFLDAEWRVSEKSRRAKFYSLTRTGRRRLEEETEDWSRRATAVARLLKAEA